MPKRIWPRRAYTQDANAKELDDAAEAVGATVLALDGLGGGVNDRLIGYKGANFLVEYKTGKWLALRQSQKNFRDWWRGQWAVVETREELFAVLGVDLVQQPGGQHSNQVHSQRASIARNLRRSSGGLLSIPGLNLTLDLALGQLTIDDRVTSLTPVESDLMAFLIANVGRCFSCVSLLSAVWSYLPGYGSQDLVRTHVRHIRQKTGTSYPLNKLRFGYYMPTYRTPRDDSLEKEV